MSSTRKFSWKTLLAFLLAAFFLVGAIGNIFPPEQIRADYARWGYPDGFHYLTGVFELAAALLLAIASQRFWGAVVGAGVMVGASATVLWHGEYTHAIAPLTVLVVCIVVGWFARPTGVSHAS